jgi:hypothetical protein
VRLRKPSPTGLSPTSAVFTWSGTKTTLARVTGSFCAEAEHDCETHCSCCHVTPCWLMDHTATCSLGTNIKSWVQLQPQPFSSPPSTTKLTLGLGDNKSSYPQHERLCSSKHSDTSGTRAAEISDPLYQVRLNI